MNRVVILVFAILSAFPLLAADKPVDPAALEAQIAKARALSRAGKYEEAIKEYKRAVKMDDKSIPALVGLGNACAAKGEDKDAVNAYRKAMPLLSNDADRAMLYNNIGLSIDNMANGDSKKLADAEQEFRTALQLNPDYMAALFNLGRVLLREKHDDQGIAELKKFVSLAKDDEERQHVRHAQRMIENPRRAREMFLPEFSLTTLDGQHITDETLQGKIVVLDFWGTWCPACRASVGELRSLAERYAKDPVVVISISTDDDEQVVRDFVAKNKMGWPQYLDDEKRITNLFNIHAFPTYLLVDSEGIIKNAQLGSGGFQLAEISSEVKKLLKEMKKQAASAAGK